MNIQALIQLLRLLESSKEDPSLAIIGILVQSMTEVEMSVRAVLGATEQQRDGRVPDLKIAEASRKDEIQRCAEANERFFKEAMSASEDGNGNVYRNLAVAEWVNRWARHIVDLSDAAIVEFRDSV